jgi:hypothetical protein
MKGTDRYRVQGVFCRLDGARDDTFDVVNLSVGGLFVACVGAPSRGTPLKLELSLPGGGRIRIVGSVAWVNDPERMRSPELPAGFGIRISRISFADKMALLKFLRDVDPARLRRP